MASALAAWSASLPITASKKKLYALNPSLPRQFVCVQRTRRKTRVQAADPRSIERDVRQLLADKISGNQVGVWLLVPEHLRLGSWDLLCAEPSHPNCLKRWSSIPAHHFAEHWPGYATALLDYRFQDDPQTLYYEIVQRSGLRAEDFHYQGFLATSPRDQLQCLTRDYPQRWNVEEFFKFNQALGWKRTGSLNLHVRYAQMSMALVAQAAIHQLRQRLGQPFANWDAEHLARNLFHGLEGDVRVRKDTILITYYNAPNADLLRYHYQDLPQKLRQQGINPKIPWLYNFQLDFRFK